MSELFIFTLVIGIISSGLTARITGRWANPATFYWSGWVISSALSPFAVTMNLLPEPSTFGDTLVYESHFAAALAFLVAATLVRMLRKNRAPTAPIDLHSPEFRLQDRLFGYLLVAQFGQGLLLLAFRVQEGGFGILFNMFNTRTLWLEENYLSDSLPIANRIYEAISLIVAVRIGFQAVRDCRAQSFSVKRVLVFLAAAAPGGISTGGRVWIALPIAFYVVSFLVCLDGGQGAKSRRWAFAKILLALLGGVGLFSIFGLVRDWQSPRGRRQFDLLEGRPDYVFIPAYYYAAGPYVAIGPYSEFSSSSYCVRGNGRYAYPFVWRQLNRLGLLPADAEQTRDWIIDSRRYVVKFDTRISSTHASYINTFIGDFGRETFPIVAFAYFLLITLLWYKAISGGVVGHVVACQILIAGAFLTPQDAFLGQPLGMIPIVGAAGLGVFSHFWVRRNRGGVRWKQDA